MNILHITPHMGGGVGAVVSAWISSDAKNVHRIISLDKNIQKNYGKQNHYLVYDGLFFNKEYSTLLINEVLKADFVVIHFWNHPLIYDLIFNRFIPECRLIMWCHISGLNEGAAIPRQVVEFVDKFIFTSPVSFESGDIINLPNELKKKLDVVWSTSIDSVNKHRREISKDNDVKIGYIGTADYSKLNKEFLSLVKNLNLKTKIVFYSNDSQECIKKQAFDFGVLDKVSFNGRAERSDLPQIYNSIDILLYPLNPKHYGTCEQVLGEAMQYGCIPVVLNNKPERYIVKNRWNGIVAEDIKEIPFCVNELINNIKLRKKLSKNAIESSCLQYSLQRCVKKWDKIFNKLLKVPKSRHVFMDDFNNNGITPAEFYAISQGANSKIFYDYINIQNIEKKSFWKNKIKIYFNSAEIFKSKSKGSVFQYLQFFPDDENLLIWSKLI